MRIYAITEQSEIGAWESTGEAFAEKDTASKRVDELTAERLASHSEPSELCELLGLDEDTIHAMSEAELLKAIKASDQDYMSDVAGNVQCGGMYSYDELDVKDAKWVK